jgi:citrate lyase beta subunit
MKRKPGWKRQDQDPRADDRDRRRHAQSAGSFAAKTERLSALAWGAEDLAADIGATSNKDERVRYTDVFRHGPNPDDPGSANARVDAIDTVFTDFRDMAALDAECRAAVRDGFTGKMAIHPDQVAVINAAFTPPPKMSSVRSASWPCLRQPARRRESCRSMAR